MTDLTSVAREAAQMVALTIGEDSAREQGFTHSCPCGCTEIHAHSQGVILGFSECASRIPSEEELAEAMFVAYADETSKPFAEEGHGIRSLYLEQARAVLSLIGERLKQ